MAVSGPFFLPSTKRLEGSSIKLIWNYDYQTKYSNPLYLHFDVKEIIYEDKDHLFIRPKMITFEEGNT